ncbi:MAG: putative porin, partial [Acidobacteriota bacterium]
GFTTIRRQDTMQPRQTLPWTHVLPAVAASWLCAAAGQAAIFEKDGLEIYGDVRVRLETDFDSRRADGSERDDRTRLRIRARLGLDYAASDHLSFGLRLRSGSDDSQQSPHITLIDFDDNDTGDADLNFDKWFAKGQLDRGWGWIGRNSLPFWKQNEFVWDDDVTPVGLALGYAMKRGENAFEVNGGYFALPAGMQDVAGHLGLAQLVFRKSRFTISGGLLDIDADPDDPDAARLLRGNGTRDYQLWVLSLQAGVGPWTFGVDAIHNGESYPASETPQDEALRDEVDAYIGSLKFNSGRGWQAVYTYAHIEALAVSSSYAGDDWVRWGSATQTRASDLKGHELRFVKDLGPGQNLVLRLFLAEAITTGEDGNRLRIDWNYKL